jgi:hypothetical protein
LTRGSFHSIAYSQVTFGIIYLRHNKKRVAVIRTQLAISVCFLLGIYSCDSRSEKTASDDSGTALKKAGSAYIHINEIMPANHHSCNDETGAFPDWIELYNGSDNDIDLEGYTLADDTDGPTNEERISAKVVISAGSVRVFWADHRPDLGPTHLPFKLKAASEKVLLYGPDDALLDRFDYSNASTNVSFARIPDGTGVFEECAAPTCDAKNGDTCAARPDAAAPACDAKIGDACAEPPDAAADRN